MLLPRQRSDWESHTSVKQGCACGVGKCALCVCVRLNVCGVVGERLSRGDVGRYV